MQERTYWGNSNVRRSVYSEVFQHILSFHHGVATIHVSRVAYSTILLCSVSNTRINMFTLVMPITQFSYLYQHDGEPTARHDNFQRFCRIGWRALRKKMQWKDVHAFFIILPRAEMHAFRQLFGDENMRHGKVQLMAQEDLMDSPMNTKWRTQMICKLLIARHVQTPHYLVLDDDLLLLRRFAFKDLFADRKQTRVRYTFDESFHTDWWQGSHEALHVPYNETHMQRLHRRKDIMSVTPQVLITHQVQQLLFHLHALHGPSWQAQLSAMKGKWTEYCLYWTYLMQAKKLALYQRGRIPLSDNHTNIWVNAPDLHESITKLVENTKQYFGVIQSNASDHEVDKVEALLHTLHPNLV
jgi:hypothetical protein